MLLSSLRLAASCSVPPEAGGARRGLRRGRSSAPLLHVRRTPPGPRCGNFPFSETPHCLSSETPEGGKQALRPFPMLLGLVGGGRDLLDNPVADQRGGPEGTVGSINIPPGFEARGGDEIGQIDPGIANCKRPKERPSLKYFLNSLQAQRQLLKKPKLPTLLLRSRAMRLSS